MANSISDLVFYKSHQFSYSAIIDNGLIRYEIDPTNGVCALLCYDTSTSARTLVGQFKTALTGNLDAVIVAYDLVKITSEEIQWRELRQNGANQIRLTFSMRRGSYFIRCKIETTTLGVDTGTYIQLYRVGGFAQLFNSAANGAAGAGDLNQDTNLNYECGYNTSVNIVAGFALTEIPTKQPYDCGAAGNYLALSNTYSTNDSGVFFMFAFPQTTSSFTIATGRANALAIAQQCLKNVDQELILVERGFYAV